MGIFGSLLDMCQKLGEVEHELQRGYMNIASHQMDPIKVYKMTS